MSEKTIRLFGWREIHDFIETHPGLTVNQLRDVLGAYVDGNFVMVSIQRKGEPAPEDYPEKARQTVLEWLRDQGPKIDNSQNPQFVALPILMRRDGTPLWKYENEK